MSAEDFIGTNVFAYPNPGFQPLTKLPRGCQLNLQRQPALAWKIERPWEPTAQPALRKSTIAPCSTLLTIETVLKTGGHG